MSNTHDRAATGMPVEAAATLPDGTLVVPKLSTSEANVAVFLQAGRVVCRGLTTTFVTSEGWVTALGATIGGEVSAGTLFVRDDATVTGKLGVTGQVTASDVKVSNARIARDVTADQMFARSIVADHLVSKASVRVEELSAKVIKDARLQGTTASGLRGVGVGDGVAAVVCTSQGVTVTDPKARIRIDPGDASSARRRAGSPSDVQQPPEPPGPFPQGPTSRPVEPRIALFHQFDVSTGADELVINHLGRYAGGVRIAGDVRVDGAVLESSSAALKDDVQPLTVDSAIAALNDLAPVSYHYIDDPSRAKRLGFIAEDVPELVAQAEHQRIRTMDIVALLTAVVQEQQRTIASLRDDVSTLTAPPSS